MKYELIHDTIARQVFDKSSVEAKARRRVIAMVDRALERHTVNQKVLLTQEDLDEIKPFERSIEFDDAEKKFIKKSKKRIQRKQRLTIALSLWAAGIMAAFLIWALLERNNAKWESRKSASIALAAKALDFQLKGDDTKALRFAQYSVKQGDTLQDCRKALLNTFYQPGSHFYSKKIRSKIKIKNAAISPVPPYLLLIWDWDGNIQIQGIDYNISDFRKLYDESIDQAGFSPDGRLILTNVASQITLSGDQQEYKLELGNPLKTYQFHPSKSLLYLLDKKGLPISWNYKTNQIDTLSKLSRDAILLSPDGEQLLFLSGSLLTYRYGFNPIKRFNKNVIAKFDPGFLPKEKGCYSLLVFPKTFNDLPKAVEIWNWCPSDNSEKKASFTKVFDSSKVEEGEIIARILYQSNPTQKGLIIEDTQEDYIPARIWKTTNIPYNPIASTGGIIKAPFSKINGILVHPEGDQAYTYSEQNLFVWELTPEKRPFTQLLNKVFEPSNQFLPNLSTKDFAVLKNQNNSLQLWDVETEQFIPLQYLKTFHLALASDQKIYTSAGIPSNDDTQWHIQTWSGKDSLMGELKLPRSELKNLALFNQGQQVATCGDTGDLRIWSINGQKQNQLNLNGPIDAIKFSPTDPEQFFTLKEIDEFETLLRLYHFSSSVVDSIYIDDNLPNITADFFPDGNQFWTQSQSVIMFWDLDVNIIDSLESSDQTFGGSSISSDGNFFIVIEDEKGRVVDLRKSQDRIWVEIPDISYAWLSKDLNYLYTLNKQQKSIHKWPFENQLILQRLDSLNISDLSPSEKQFYRIIK